MFNEVNQQQKAQLSRFDKIHAQRLTDLANRLLSDKPLKVGEFFFATYYDGEPVENCKTMGCALGENALMHPQDWTIHNGYPILRELKKRLDRLNKEDVDPRVYDESLVVDESTMRWFGLDEFEVKHLFYSRQQHPNDYGGDILDDSATRKEVGNNIVEFLKIKREATK
jgi:hypothetical protein